MNQLKRILTAILAAFGAFFPRVPAQGKGGNFNFRRVFGAVCLSAMLGVGNVAFAAAGLPATGERINLAASADMNLRDDKKGFSPVLLAYVYRHYTEGDKEYREGWHHIHYAASNGNWKALRGMVRNEKIDINRRTAKKNETPLHIASWYGGNKNAVKYLMEARAEIDARNIYGKTPLHKAAAAGHRDIVKLLLKNRAKLDARDVDNKTPLHQAAQAGKNLMVKLLVKEGADIHARDKHGFTPFRLALEHGKSNVAKSLRRLGSDDGFVTYQGSHGRTNLHFAVRDNKPKLIDALVKVGANIEVEDRRGFTPLHVAAEYRSVDAARTLIKLGANVSAKNKKGQYPIDIALHFFAYQDEITRVLRHQAYLEFIEHCGKHAPRWICEIRYRLSGVER